MKISVPALAAALVATIGAVSAAHAAVSEINFAVNAQGGDLSYSGARLGISTAFDFDGSTLEVSRIGSIDDSGLIPGDTVTLSPTDVVYGSGTGMSSLATDVVKSWTAGGDTFTETLTEVLSIDRDTANAITVSLKGTIMDTGGLFPVGTPAFLILQANQVGGPGTVISAGFTNTSVLGSVPEPATWVMMTLGFIGLGYAAVRRTSKDRSAVAII